MPDFCWAMLSVVEQGSSNAFDFLLVFSLRMGLLRKEVNPLLIAVASMVVNKAAKRMCSLDVVK